MYTINNIVTDGIMLISNVTFILNNGESKTVDVVTPSPSSKEDVICTVELRERQLQREVDLIAQGKIVSAVATDLATFVGKQRTLPELSELIEEVK